MPDGSFIYESPTPPSNLKVGALWTDSTDPGNKIVKYWDGDEWARMDGGSTDPTAAGMVARPYISENGSEQHCETCTCGQYRHRREM